MTKNDIIKTLIQAREDYYNKGESNLTDEQFDNLEDTLRELDSNNDYFKSVGIDVTYGEKVKHLFPMLSTDKAKTITEVMHWINKTTKNSLCYVIEPKIDGLSGSLYYEDGILKTIATRGNGIEGQNVTHVQDYINIPKTIDLEGDVEVKGEFYIPKNTELGNEKLRNKCSGIINRKSYLKDLKYVKFIAYQLKRKNNVTDFESKNLEILEKLNFKTILFNTTIIEESTIENTVNEIKNYNNLYLEKFRNSWEYETDGLVITVNDSKLREIINKKWEVNRFNHYEIALKPPTVSQETPLKDIEWNISHHGNLIPTAIFETIDIDGAQISRASLHNFQNVFDLNLKQGCILEVERANDVIPYIKRNLNQDEEPETSIDLYPSKCPSCDGELVKDGVNLSCKNKKCPEQSIQKIIYWCKKAEVKDFSEASIKTLFKEEIISDVLSLYTNLVDPDYKADIISIAGFGEKKVNKIISEIDKSRTMNLHEFINRLGILLVGIKAMKKLNINTLEEFWNFDKEEYVIGQNLIKYRDENEDEIIELLNELKVTEVQSMIDSKGKVAMTGKGPKSRNDLIKIIENKGYEFCKSVAKDTDILLCEDSNGTSVKLDKARKNGTKIISYEDFLK